MNRFQRVSSCILTVVIVMVFWCDASFGVSRSIILRLRSAAQAQYPNAGDVMDRYSLMVYGGKEYATTRGVVNGVPTVAVWEYVPNEWHRIFDYPLAEASSPEVAQRYRSYGFTWRHQKRLVASPKWFPGMKP